MSTTAPIPQPATNLVVNASQASVGVPIPPIRRLAIMEAGEWEEFILEWVNSLRTKYTDVHRCGSAGDMGRDVIGFKNGLQGPWDNYQCKHYGKPLPVSNVLAELGKLIYYVTLGEFPFPDAYSFVAPRGPSTDLLKSLQKNTLKQQLIARWEKECRTTITARHAVELTSVQAAIDAFDFTRVAVLSPLAVIDSHHQTPYYTMRFGGGMPSRSLPIPKPPAAFQPHESVYIKKLFDAYDDEKQTTFPTIDTLKQHAPELGDHLDRSREQFFSAESLRTFSRDNVNKGTFEILQQELHDGVQEVYQDDEHKSGYRRALKTVQKARDIQLTSNPLIGVLLTNDRAGICHQLANDDKLTWVREPNS